MYNDSSIDFKPKLLAKNLLNELGLDVPYNLNDILGLLGISFKEMPLNQEFDGALICKDGNYGIIINSNIAYDSRKRFTVAHELGHYWIPEHHTGDGLYCESSNIGAFDKKKDLKEYEADIFASEFLMPEKVIKEHIQQLDPRMKSIEELANKYMTSLTATALKFVEYTMEPCALVLMQNRNIRWTKKSKSFKYELKRKPDDCNAYDIIDNGGDEIYDSLYSNMWLINCNREYIWEEAINFKNLNQQLILLTFNDTM